MVELAPIAVSTGMNQINPNDHFVESKVVPTGAIAKVIPNRAKRPGVRQPPGALDSSPNALQFNTSLRAVMPVSRASAWRAVASAPLSCERDTPPGWRNSAVDPTVLGQRP
jgi:hypothetical protein